jgi:hypothetical protein
MSAEDSEDRNTGAGGTTGSETGSTTGAGGTTGSDDTGAAFDAPATVTTLPPGNHGGEDVDEDTGAAFDAPADGARNS